MDFVNLIKTGTGWEFATEADLEDFIWINLKELLGLTPWKRQYYVNGQYCDILALSKTKQLVVLELKNTEDRYIVQQLTRYYDALQDEKPLLDEIDHKQPIGLVAIQPNFHRDNFIDKKYNCLSIQFIKFTIFEDSRKYVFNLEYLDNGKISTIEIPHHPKANNNIPAPPRGLISRLSKCTNEQQEVIMKIRSIILSFDSRMQEINSANGIKYGNGNSNNSKFCAEFYFDSKGCPFIFLWLGLKNNKSERIGRARIWTDWQGNALLEGYVVSGIGTKLTSYNNAIIKQIQLLQNIAKKGYIYSPDFKHIRKYFTDRNRIVKKLENSESLTYEERKLLELDANNYFTSDERLTTYKFDKYNSLEELVDLALEKWIKRI